MGILLLGFGISHAPVQTSKSPDAIEDLTFDDIKFEMDKEAEFDREFLTERINELNGKKIRIRGYILPSFKQTGIEAFILVRDNQECCFGPGAALCDCILVRLEKGRKTDFTVRPITVRGTFFVKERRIGGKVLAVFRMKNVVIE